MKKHSNAGQPKQVRLTEYDAYISYRRQGGAATARLVYEILKTRNVLCFLDHEELSSGDFTKNLRNGLEKSDNFLLVVTQNMLDRCADPKDWVRQEIETALSLFREEQIHIIFAGGVVNVESLPQAIKKIADFNGYIIDHMNFEGPMEKLVDALASPRKQFLNAFITAHDAAEEDDLEFIFDMVRENFISVEQRKDIFKSIYKLVRKYLVDVKDVSDILLRDYSTDFIRDICREINIDPNGIKFTLLDRIRRFINRGEGYKNIKTYFEYDEDMDLEVKLAKYLLEQQNKVELQKNHKNKGNKGDIIDNIICQESDDLIALYLNPRNTKREDLINILEYLDELDEEDNKFNNKLIYPKKVLLQEIYKRIGRDMPASEAEQQ
jgi:hypothetical protein